MRQCTVRGLSDGRAWEEWARVEKHLCADCRPDAWIILTLVPAEIDVEESAVSLRATDALKLGKAIVQIAEDIIARKM